MQNKSAALVIVDFSYTNDLVLFIVSSSNDDANCVTSLEAVIFDTHWRISSTFNQTPAGAKKGKKRYKLSGT